MTYRAPVADIVFTMRHVAGLDRALADGLSGDLSADLAETILEEAGRFANDVIAPLEPRRATSRRAAEGRRASPPRRAGRTPTRPGPRPAGTRSPGPVRIGGQGLPILLNSACVEMWNARLPWPSASARC